MRMLRSSFKTSSFSELGISDGYHLTKVISLIQRFSSTGEVAPRALADEETLVGLVADMSTTEGIDRIDGEAVYR